jgi:ABC-type sugar transport system permease subunit
MDGVVRMGRQAMERHVQIGAALAFPFRGPKAWANLGGMLVCMLIPIVGPIVIQGYQVRVEKVLIENIQADAPGFDFGKFSHYLQLGLPGFLASLVLTLIMMVIFLPLGVGILLAVLFLQKHVAWMIAVIAALALMEMVLSLAAGALVMPMMYKAGLEGRFGAAFDWGFVVDYARKVGLLTVGMQMLLSLMLIPVMPVVLCLPIVGPYAVIAVFMMVQVHVWTQLYLTYLARGGRAIAIKPEPVESGGFEVVRG